MAAESWARFLNDCYNSEILHFVTFNKMFVILIVVIGLVAWSLHLMQEAVEHREFSLMLAGFLVATAAAAMMTVYFLMGHYVGYMTQMAHRSSEWSEWTDVAGNELIQPQVIQTIANFDLLELRQ